VVAGAGNTLIFTFGTLSADRAIYGQVKPGDCLIAYGVEFPVTAVTEHTVTVADVSGGGNAAQIADIGSVSSGDKLTDRNIKVKQVNCQPSARQFVSAVSDSDNAINLEFRPLMSLMAYSVPLFLMKGGLEIRFELEDGARAFVEHTSQEVGLNGVSFQYEITTPRLMAMMVRPHRDIIDEFVQQWRSEDGLVYHIPSVRTRRVNGAGETGNVNLQMNPGVRSGNRVYTIIQDSDIAEGSGAQARANQSISLFSRSGITKFQYKVGAHEYPNRDVNCDNYSSEAFEQLTQTANGVGGRLIQGDWTSFGNVYISQAKRAFDSRHFILSADLSRDKSAQGVLSGVDLSIVPLDLQFERSGTHASIGYEGSPAYYTFIEHDAFLKINQQQMAIMS
jgi:hypothetical protein